MKLSAHELKYFNYVKIEKQILKTENYRQIVYVRIIVHYIKERRFLPPKCWSKTFEFKRSSKPSDRQGYISYTQDDEFLELRDQLKEVAEKNTVTITREQYEAVKNLAPELFI
ncbi:hypothetical protein [Vibrio phage phiKT1024]|nr:hypothetical protein [Vibrio phage phiKT1024]